MPATDAVQTIAPRSSPDRRLFIILSRNKTNDVERADQIDGDDFRKVRKRLRPLFSDRALSGCDAGAVDRTLDTAELLERNGDCRMNLGFISHVGLHESHGRSQLRCELRTMVAHIENDDVRSAAGEFTHARRAQARASTSNKNRFPGNVHARASPLECLANRRKRQVVVLRELFPLLRSAPRERAA